MAQLFCQDNTLYMYSYTETRLGIKELKVKAWQNFHRILTGLGSFVFSPHHNLYQAHDFWLSLLGDRLIFVWICKITTVINTLIHFQNVNEYDQEILQSYTADQPKAP